MRRPQCRPGLPGAPPHSSQTFPFSFPILPNQSTVVVDLIAQTRKSFQPRTPPLHVPMYDPHLHVYLLTLQLRLSAVAQPPPEARVAIQRCYELRPNHFLQKANIVQRRLRAAPETLEHNVLQWVPLECHRQGPPRPYTVEGFPYVPCLHRGPQVPPQ